MLKFIKAAAILLFSLSASGLYAQSYVGVFGGLNSSKLTGDAPTKAKYQSLMGANTGAYIDIKIAKIVWLSIQPSYSQEGTKVSYSVRRQVDDVDSLKLRLNYFSLPLFLKVSSTNGRFYALGGFEAGMLLDHKLTSNGELVENDANILEWNLAVHFGAGIRIPIGYPRLFVELRYSQGVIDLTDEPVERSYIPRVKTSGFKVLAGIEIPLKRTK